MDEQHIYTGTIPFINAGVYELEEQLYALLRERARYNAPPLIDGVLAPVIASEVSRLHKPAVAYLGPEHSFTWEAAVAMFPHGAHVPYRTITDVFKAVDRGAADYGVVPFINSLEGPVGETVDALATHGVEIASMGELRVTLCIAKKGVPRVIYTHPHAAAQARKALAALSAEVVYTSSTSEAVKEFEKCSADCAVLASPKALERYEKTCGVEDGESYTRFAVPNVAGALYKALAPLAERGINMTLIYSRPTKLSPWDYFFLVEVETGPALEPALEELRSRTTMLKVVGRYNVIALG